ncbi:MAG: hypothetical protein GXO43_06030 [Crenarchaeota archaeon]|nr:hypothetical protein [Thermoproteota archaeon]
MPWSVLDRELELLGRRKRIEEVCGDHGMAEWYERRIERLRREKERLERMRRW